MNKLLKQNLDILKTAVKEDFDMFFIVDGLEGAGKSVLAQFMAGYLDPTLNIDRICFNPEEFVEAVKKAKKNEAIIYDEAIGGLMGRAAISSVNKMLVQVLAECRQKNLFVFIVLPCFFELDRYPAIWRSIALAHVYTKRFKRGYFKFYSQDRKKKLYLKGKKFYQYLVKPNFIGTFPKGYYVPEQEYRDKKLKVLNKLGQNESSSENKNIMKVRDKFKKLLKDGRIPFDELYTIMDIPRSTAYDWRKEYQESLTREDGDRKDTI